MKEFEIKKTTECRREEWHDMKEDLRAEYDDTEGDIDLVDDWNAGLTDGTIGKTNLPKFQKWKSLQI